MPNYELEFEFHSKILSASASSSVPLLPLDAFLAGDFTNNDNNNNHLRAIEALALHYW